MKAYFPQYNRILYRKSIQRVIVVLLLLSFSINFLNIQISPIVCTSSSDSTLDKYQYSEIFRMEQGSTKFYVTSLDPNEIWAINLTAFYQGIFYLFIFQKRPTSDFILSNFSIDPAIYEQAAAYNTSIQYIFDSDLNQSVSNIRLNYNYTGIQTLLVYLQIVLVENGPDSYKLESSHVLGSYYIPFINGYDNFLVIAFGTTQLVLISILIRKKRLK